MKKLINKIHFKSIRDKMLAGFSVVILFIIGIVVVAGTSSYYAGQQSNAVIQEYIPRMMKLDELTQNFINRNKVVYEYLVTDNEARADEFVALTEESLLLEQELLEEIDNEEIAEAVNAAAEWSNNVRSSVINQHAQGNDLIASSSLNNLNPIANRILQIYEGNLETVEAEVAAIGEEVERSQNIVIFLTVALGIIAILLSVFIAWMTSKSITKPIQKMRDRLNAFAKEDFSGEPIEIETQDEIGELGLAVNETQANLVNLMMSVKETIGLLTDSGQDLDASSREVLVGANQITATMQELASGAESQANSASNLAGDMDAFSQTTSDTLAYGEEIKKAAKDVTEKTAQGNELMTLSSDQMRIVNEIVDDAVSQMNQLIEQTNQISNLVDFINNIAKQTNLLALNASIEAARAGEQGRGFAVVADEVRNLAEEVASSVSEITEYVQNVTEDAEKVAQSLQNVNTEVEVGTVQIQATDENLGEINQSIAEMEERNKQMAENLNEIAKRSQEMNTLIDEVASISQESAAGVEETSASVEEINSSMEEMGEQTDGLAHLANNLNQLIKNVKVYTA